MLDIAAICLVVTALLAYLNHRFIGLPTTIGVMVAALGLSLLLVLLDALGLVGELRAYEESFLRSIDFSNVLMQGMLSLLLFAGAMHVDISELRAYRWQIGTLAVVGTVLSTAVVGLAMWWLLPLLGLPMPLTYCLLFGALISPTDPIAVMGILKSVGAPKNLELVIAGESLFNDGVGVVVFALLLGMLTSGEVPSFGHGAELLLHEAGGGLLFGLVLGYVTFRLLRSIDHYQVEVLLTLAAVMGGYALASRLHVSGPLAMVVAGLMIGNHGRALAMSDTTRRHLDLFWELLDEILNAVLFVLIGMEVIVISFGGRNRASGGCRDRRDAAGSHPDDRPAGRAVRRCLQAASRRWPGADLGRAARRYLGRAGIVAAGRTAARDLACADLLRGRLFDPGARPDDRKTGSARDRQMTPRTRRRVLSVASCPAALPVQLLHRAHRRESAHQSSAAVRAAVECPPAASQAASRRVG